MKQTLYISNPESKKIYVWNINISGELTLIQILNTSHKGQPICISPNKNYIYLGVRENNGIITYKIKNNGLLHKINFLPLLYSPTQISIHPMGKFLYIASYTGNNLTICSIHNKKNNILIPRQIISNLKTCHSSYYDKINNIIWITSLKNDKIYLYNIQKNTGFLYPINQNLEKSITLKNNSGPRHLSFHPTKPFAYIINELNGTISIINIQNVLINHSNIINKYYNILPLKYYNEQNNLFWASDIHITPNGKWLFCTDRKYHTLSYFSVTSTGENLNFINYIYTEKQPRSFCIDKTGNFIIVSGQKSNYFSIYKINQITGMPNLIKRYNIEQGGLWVAVL